MSTPFLRASRPILVVAALLPLVASNPLPPTLAVEHAAGRRAPIEPNRGQFAPDVAFALRAAGGQVSFAAGRVELPGEATLGFGFLGGADPGTLEPVDPLPGLVHYVPGSDPAGWVTDVPTFGGLLRRGVYPGVDVLFRGGATGLELEFVLAPGADPSAVVLDFGRSGVFRLDGEGAAVLESGPDAVRIERPVVERGSVGSLLPAGGTVALRLNGADAAALVRVHLSIDVAVPPGHWSADLPRLATDAGGDAFVAGSLGGVDFEARTPGRGAGRVRQHRGARDVHAGPAPLAELTGAFVTRVSGDSVVETAWFGGDGERPRAIATAPGGDVVIAGAAGEDAFALRLSRSGLRPIREVTIGGGGEDVATAVAVAGEGEIWLAGKTDSSDLPLTAAALQARPGGGADAWIARLDANLTVTALTFLGGSGDDEAVALALDGSGALRVAGTTSSPDFPVRSPLQARGGGRDAFLATVDPATGTLTQATFYGGAGDEAALGLAVERGGAMLLLGDGDRGFLVRIAGDGSAVLGSASLEWPAAALALDHAGRLWIAGNVEEAGLTDAFVARLAPETFAPEETHLLAGDREDRAGALLLDARGTALVAGLTRSDELPGATRMEATAGGDAFLARIVPDTEAPQGACPGTGSADLTVTPTDAPDPVAAGDPITYALTVHNGGPDPATLVTLTDVLSGTSFDSATPSQGTCGEAAGTVTCNLGTIASGADATITILVTAGAPGTASASATAASAECDPTPVDNTDVATSTTVLPACLDGDTDGYAVCTAGAACLPAGGDQCGDCDDTSAARHPGLAELCDGIDNDCAGGVPADEADGDTDTFRVCQNDCNDGDAAVNPGVVEADPLCNDAIDNDCDGDTDLADPSCQGICPDGDGDAYAVCSAGCLPDVGDECGDCDDVHPNVHPGATEQCNGVDDDCVGGVPADEADGDGDDVRICEGDCDDTDPEVHPGATEGCNGVDDDCAGGIPANEADGDGDGTRVCQNDCNDGDPNIHPGVLEQCNGVDDDCDGSVPTTEANADGDGFRVCDGDCDDDNPLVRPDAPEICDGLDTNCDGTTPANEVDGDADGYRLCQGDCDDGDAAVNPGVVEDDPFCGDGVDNDCDGATDLDDPTCLGFCPDGDGDGYAVCNATCLPDTGDQCGDCDDGAAGVHPGAAEQCNGVDDDCVGGVPTSEADADGDGFRVCQNDCNDGDAGVNPGATEQCNGVDDDCVGGVPQNESDADADGFRLCQNDCNDGNGSIHPGVAEQCNGVDDDCSGGVPANEADADGDGARICGGDCNDGDAAIRPGAVERCNGLDDDCNDAVPANEADADEDGVRLCGNDCDDTDPEVNPLVSESGDVTCADSIDNDCDGNTDLGDVGCAVLVTSCATLGDQTTGTIDEDVFTLAGHQNETVTITLTAEGGAGGRADLVLIDAMEDAVDFFRIDRTALPNQIAVTLPANGPYRIAVREHPPGLLLPGSPFRGGYCLAVDASAGAAQTLAPTSSVEGVDQPVR